MSGDARRSVTDEWNSECQESFDILKVLVTTAPVLQCPNFEKEFILETDASFQGLGAVLSQRDENGKVHPVCYASRGLRRSERNMANYSSRKLELLALKWAVADKFHNYLAGRHFTVYTDNSPLSHLETAKLGAIESRWCNDLQQFNFTIKYKAGRDNTIADELSRLPQETEGSDSDEVYTVMSARRDEMTTELWSRRELEDLQGEMVCFEGIKKLLRGELTDERKEKWLINEDFRKLYRTRANLVLRDDAIYHQLNTGINTWRVTPVLPPKLQLRLMQACHDHFGHQGRNRSLALVRVRGFWPGMASSVGEYISRCEKCRVGKDEFPKARTFMGTVEASKPWELLAMDFTLLDKRMGVENVLVVTDVFTRYSFAFPTKDQKASTVAKLLKDNIFDKL